MRYDEIGKTYNNTRVPDERITRQLLALLDKPVHSTVLDVGAGTGNYSYQIANSGYKVIAVEPSKVMRGQSKQHDHMEWREGFAENLPVADGSVDGVICTLASHHFNDLALSFREMARVVNNSGRIIIFTADPRICSGHCWIADYFGEIVERSYRLHPALKDLIRQMEENTKRKVNVKSFPLPFDLQDNFFFSGWRRPEMYFNEKYRAGISSLATAPTEMLTEALERLRDDLQSGKWHQQYGQILHANEYDCGYFFLIA